MKNEKDKRQVLDVLNRALATDKTKSRVLGFTQLGLVEMTRKKAKRKLTHILETPCPTCGGSGRILSQDTIAINTAQKIYSLAKEPDVTRIQVMCHPAVAGSIIGKNKANLKMMQKQTRKKIKVSGVEEFEHDQIEISCERK